MLTIDKPKVCLRDLLLGLVDEGGDADHITTLYVGYSATTPLIALA